MNIRVQNRTAFALILIFIIVSVLTARRLSITADEAKHLQYGLNILSLNSNRFDDSKMPVSVLNAFPSHLGNLFPEGTAQRYLKKFLVARTITPLFSALVAWTVFIWARRLYGFSAGLVALVLYIFDPNIIAHSQLVTTDIYATGTLLFFTYSLWKFSKTRHWQDGLFCAAMLGLSLLAKYTSVVLIPIALLTLILHDFLSIKQSYRKSGWSEVWTYLWRLLTYVLVAFLVSLLIINVGFLFNRSLTVFGDYQFRSTFFLEIQENMPFLEKLSIPVPYPYLEGLDWVIEREQSGFGYGRIYLFGQLHENQGFPGYYIFASLLKIPLASQIVFWLATVSFFIKGRYKNFFDNEIFLFIPLLFFTLYFNFFFNAQIGIRFYLIVFPLIFIFAGSLIEKWDDFSLRTKILLFALLSYFLTSVFSYSPFFLTYFNEIVWDRKTAYRYLADSNLDWDQGELYLNEYLAEHPQTDYAPLTSKPGMIVVSVNDLVGVTADPVQYKWLRENFNPVDTIANEYLVYRISNQEYNQKCAETGFCK